ncbi:hypothetical protein CC78DRAFT_325690 [Lojkania enalia]|uniref:Uncharacterized protein n=1 Tax=Lojkania enalia TaxID=147567 RepID=A0A9P4K4Q0_9PLEO|nr:hypothetical protein CC78DRAFT_325690 [Didymosphaeria enalia]
MSVFPCFLGIWYSTSHGNRPFILCADIVSLKLPRTAADQVSRVPKLRNRAIHEVPLVLVATYSNYSVLRLLAKVLTRIRRSQHWKFQGGRILFYKTAIPYILCPQNYLTTTRYFYLITYKAIRGARSARAKCETSTAFLTGANFRTFETS